MTEQAQPLRNKKFVKDLGIYALGNLGSKLITFLLIPFYTFFIDDPAAFGYYDICANTMFCLIPIIGMQLNDGGFRFLIDNQNETRRAEVVTFVYRSLARNCTLAIVLGLIATTFVHIHYLWLSIGFGLSQTIYDVELQIVRGLGKTTRFVTAGIINTSLIAITSIIFIAVLDMGIPGIFLSNILSRLITVVFVDVSSGIFRKYFNPRLINRTLNKEILRYSLPLIPAALCWWLISSNNYYFLQYFRGLADTGLYGFVGRFTGILYILSFIFYQTWQQNAIEQYNSPDRDRFFSSVFNNYLFLLIGLTVCFSFGLRLFYPLIIGAEFQISSQYLFLNSIYVILFALSQFFELGYQCSKQTKFILPSLGIAIAINLTGNFFLVQLWGINGIIVSNILTWGAMLIYRAIDTRRFMVIRFAKVNYICAILLIGFGIIFYLLSTALTDTIAILTFIIIYGIIMPKDFRRIVVRRLKIR